MGKIKFGCDYLEGAHPRILQRLIETNYEQHEGYSEDTHCDAARQYILQRCKREGAQVHFLVGGTQTNMTVIASVLRPHQGVISAHTGHVNVHETGAIEAQGHKVLALPSPDGKITGDQVRACVWGHREDENFEHMVQPGMVYVSNPTENGTMYTKAELQDLRAACDECGIPLYLDGARMGYALCAPGNDLFMEDYAELCDLFYIGGTKCGMLMGEAVVICNPALQKDFRYLIKQKGGMLAKGRLLGVQFEEMFKDGLYEEACGHGIKMALKLKQGLVEKGYEFLFDSNSNQQFPILTEEKRAQLAEKYEFAFWERVDENRVGVRFCTSWATKESAIDALLADL